MKKFKAGDRIYFYGYYDQCIMHGAWAKVVKSGTSTVIIELEDGSRYTAHEKQCHKLQKRFIKEFDEAFKKISFK